MSTPSPPPGPGDPFGAPYPQQPTPAPPTWGGRLPPPVEHLRDPGVRPATVTAAVWTTVGLSVLSIVANVGVLIGGPRLVEYIRDHRGDFELSAREAEDLDAITSVLVVSAVAFIVASLVACGVAYAVLRRHRWARITLVVLSSVCAAVGLLGLVTVLVGGLWLVGAAAVILLLFTGGANEWFGPRPVGPWPPGAGGPQEWSPPYPPQAGPPLYGPPPDGRA